jgi:two-component system, LytTR family, sensor kinase
VSKLTFDLVPTAGGPADEESRLTKRARGRAVIWLTSGLWVANYAAATAGAYLGDGHDLGRLSMIRAGMLAVGLLLCASIHFILGRLAHMSFGRRVAAVLVMSLVAAEAYGWLSYFAFSVLAPGHLATSIRWGPAISNMASWTWFFLAWAGLRLALEYSWDAKDEQRRSMALQELAHTAEVRALHSQINPHFLFNSLNSISALIVDGRRNDADRMVSKLADFFRLTISIDPRDDIPLERELQLQIAYLEIEQLRFPDLSIDLDIPTAARSAYVPALILQPLVENAVKFGVASSNPPAIIAVRARMNGEDLVLTVTDGGRPNFEPARPGVGIGLNNVRSRLHERFGSRASLRTERVESGGFKVTISMPLVTA